MKVLVISPHPDDEVLGCGGTMARLAKENHDIHVVILTKASPPLFTEEQLRIGRENAKKSHDFLGVKESIFCDFPAAGLDMVPHSEVNQVLGDVVSRINPDVMFVPFASDIHLDHQYTFLSSLVAARPNRPVYPRKIYAYETLSETNWNAPYVTSAFHPNAFFDISDYLEMKLQAFNLYQDQVKAFPHERSLNALRALATLRGSTVHREAAEAFLIVREVL